MFAPLFAPAHLHGLIIGGSLVLAAAVVFATTGQETRPEPHERRSKSRNGRNTRSVFWWKGVRKASPATEEGEQGSATGSASARPRSLPAEVVDSRAALARRRKALEDRAGGQWNSAAEARIAEAAVLLPAEICVTFNDIVGLDDVVKEMRQRVVLPLLRHDYSPSTDSLPTSVLLHGPSGCGKRTMALAVAREARAVFIDARAALDRWHGPAAQCMALIWNVAHALQSAVVYVDESDPLLGMLCPAANPSQSATLGRGYSGASGSDVLLIGCAPDISNLDPEAAGHFPLRYSVPVPGAGARQVLLLRFLVQECRKLNLGDMNIDLWRMGPVDPGKLTLRQCAVRTPGFSGSALRALARRTAEMAMDEAVANGSSKGEISAAHLAQALADFVPLYSR